MSYKRFTRTYPRPEGFTLPVVLLIGLSLMIIGLSAMQTNSSIRMSFEDQYYNRLANEAAEAGIVRANYCLDQNAYAQQWGSNKDATTKPPLTQGTDCLGTNASPALSSLISASNIRSTFSVPDLEVRDDGAIVIASQGTAAVLNSSGTTIRSYSVTLKQLVNWKVFEASKSYSGAFRTCGIITGEAYCWGTNQYGQLGNGTTTDSLTPVKVVEDAGLLAGKHIDDMFTAQWHNCVLTAGKVYCWGRNNAYQLGNNTTTDSSRPLLVQGALAGKTVTEIGGTNDTSCAIAGGKIYCWGATNTFNDGRFDTTGTNAVSGTKRQVPTLVATTNLDATYGAGNYTAIALATSGSYSQTMCAIINNGSSTTNGDAWCWGNNEAGQVGDGTTTGTKIPVKVKNNVNTDALYGKTVTVISQDGATNGPNGTGTSNNSSHTCVIASDGKAYCWGENNSGQLGIGSSVDKSVPTAVSTAGILNGKTIAGISSGIYHTCALAANVASCWGYGGAGQLGTGSTASKTIPTAVDTTILSGKTITSIGGGTNRGCVVADFKSYCWGVNSSGQIGDGTTVDRSSPTESVYLRPKAPAFIF